MCRTRTIERGGGGGPLRCLLIGRRRGRDCAAGINHSGEQMVAPASDATEGSPVYFLLSPEFFFSLVFIRRRLIGSFALRTGD